MSCTAHFHFRISAPELNLNMQMRAASFLFFFCPVLFQQAAFHPEVSEDLRSKALQYSSECTTGYLNLLEQVLQVRMRHSQA